MGFLHKDMWRGNSDVKKGQMGILHKEMWRGNSDFKKEDSESFFQYEALTGKDLIMGRDISTFNFKVSLTKHTACK